MLDAQEAILLINSPDVVIENNEITGAKRRYTALDEQSSVHTRNNRKRLGKWPPQLTILFIGNFNRDCARRAKRNANRFAS